MLDLRVRGPIVGRLAVELGSRLGAAFPALVGGDPSCDREHPGAQVAAVPQAVVAAERPEKGLLKCILGPLPPEQAHEVREDGVAVLRVEALERRDGHRFHHPLQRGGRGGCEMRGRRPRRVGGLRPGRAGARGRRDPDDERPLGRAGGGGAVAAAELLRLGAETTFFTAVGEDELGRRGGGAACERASARGLGSCRPSGGRSRTWIPAESARSPCSARSCTARGRPARVGAAGRDGRRLPHRRRPGGAT